MGEGDIKRGFAHIRIFSFFYNYFISIDCKNELTMNISQIKNEQDYQGALNRLEQILDAEKGSIEGNELEILSILIENYENEHYPIAAHSLKWE